MLRQVFVCQIRCLLAWIASRPDSARALRSRFPRAGLNCRLDPLGIERAFAGPTGGATHLWRENGLDRASIVRVAASAFLPVANQAAIV